MTRRRWIAPLRRHGGRLIGRLPGPLGRYARRMAETLTYASELEVDFTRMERTSSGLWIEEIAEGVGRQAMTGRETVIQYIGYLPDGTVVDASVGGEPFSFDLGSPDVIRGWNEGIAGMKVGGRRRLVVRPGLAYGSRGRSPAVPPQAVLVFEIQLVDVR